jgi:hypothetical protein
MLQVVDLQTTLMLRFPKFKTNYSFTPINQQRPPRGKKLKDIKPKKKVTNENIKIHQQS